jgi:hypothetical protein
MEPSTGYQTTVDGDTFHPRSAEDVAQVGRYVDPAPPTQRLDVRRSLSALLFILCNASVPEGWSKGKPAQQSYVSGFCVLKPTIKDTVPDRPSRTGGVT